MSTSDLLSEFKKRAAVESVNYIESGMIVGLGTGSTVQFALEEIASRIHSGKLIDILGVPTSVRTRDEATRLGIPLTKLTEHPHINLTIDGADEVDENLNLIKGGGGALLHEKIVAQNSDRVIIIVDESKLSKYLGEKFYLPVEVIRCAEQTETNYIRKLGAKVEKRFNEMGEPYITDENNFLLKCTFGKITEPVELSAKLNDRAGIIGHGLFVGLTSKVIVAGEKRVWEIDAK